MRSGASVEIRSFLKFDVTGLAGAPTSATLRLYVVEAGPGGSVYRVSNSYDGGSNPWTESGVTWNNQPVLEGSELDGLGTVGAGTWAEYDVSAAITGNGTYSFGLYSDSNNRTDFRSRDGASNHPQLVIHTAGGSATPTVAATATSSAPPSTTPTADTPSATPTDPPTSAPTDPPTSAPTDPPTSAPTDEPSATPVPSATYTASATPAASPTSGGGSLELAADADSWVHSGSPNENNGAAGELRMKHASNELRGFLKFVVTGLSGAPSSATLRLFASDGGPGGYIYSVSNDFGGTSNPWTEFGLTWNNQPGTQGSELDYIGTVGTGTWAEYDVTAGIAGNGTYSFGIYSDSSDLVKYHSREAASQTPELVIVP
jgi:hypothetical protein